MKIVRFEEAVFRGGDGACGINQPLKTDRELWGVLGWPGKGVPAGPGDTHQAAFGWLRQEEREFEGVLSQR